MKKGRFSREETMFIRTHHEEMSIGEMSKHLDRSIESIEKFVREKLRVGLSNQDEAALGLEDRPYWTELKQQFTDDELELIKWHWSHIVTQFRDDVIHTEELQILDLIKLDILSHRCLKHNKDALRAINEIDVLIREEQSHDPDQINKEYIIHLRRDKAALQAGQETSTKEYRELQTKKNSMLKEMRATREQRIKRLEDSTQSLTGWIVHLMNNPDQVREYGLQMEKMKLAMKHKTEELSEYHTYSDGMVDQPFLNADTVK